MEGGGSQSFMRCLGWGRVGCGDPVIPTEGLLNPTSLWIHNLEIKRIGRSDRYSPYIRSFVMC